MFGYPFIYPPQQQQKSIKEQLEEAEAMIKFFKEKFKEDDKKKEPTKWYKSKMSLWDTALCIAIISFFLALPITVWLTHMLYDLHEALNTLFK